MPPYIKNYYRILGLDVRSSLGLGTGEINKEEMKKAYRKALLGVHPDKSAVDTGTGDGNGAGGGPREGGRYTVDDVREAWSVLGDEERRREYDMWFMTSGRSGVEDGGGERGVGQDFVLGLEVLDLADFEEVVSSSPTSSSISSSSTSSSSSVHSDQMNQTTKGQGAKEGTQWTRPCRCGAPHGFRITEKELEDALERGEAEVLVGCEGCSLWVRVGFGVEEGDG